jgi:hypothetical protein
MNPLFEKSVGKGFFFMSLVVVGFFCFLILDWYILQFKLDSIILRHVLRFFGELSTIPLLFAQPVLLVFSIIYCIKDKFRIKTYSFWSFIISLTGNLLIIYFMNQ